MSKFTNASGLSVRVKSPQREQMRMRTHSLDQLLPHDHQARVLWQYVCSLEPSGFYRDIQAVEGGRGRDAVDPRILLCLWLLATLEGISSARRLAALLQSGTSPTSGSAAVWGSTGTCSARSAVRIRRRWIS